MLSDEMTPLEQKAEERFLKERNKAISQIVTKVMADICQNHPDVIAPEHLARGKVIQDWFAANCPNAGAATILKDLQLAINRLSSSDNGVTHHFLEGLSALMSFRRVPRTNDAIQHFALLVGELAATPVREKTHATLTEMLPKRDSV